VTVTAAQIRAARSLLGRSQAEVARVAKVSVPTIKRAEADSGIAVSDDARERIWRALEGAGVEFTNGDRPVVRLKAKRKL
jgi:hypothetical protein